MVDENFRLPRMVVPGSVSAPPLGIASDFFYSSCHLALNLSVCVYLFIYICFERVLYSQDWLWTWYADSDCLVNLSLLPLSPNP